MISTTTHTRKSLSGSRGPVFRNPGLYRFLKNLHGCILAGFLAVFIISGTASADVPEPASSPCDPSYWSSLKSRAWMEAQREITQNQNLIFKPDSVFEYTCFKDFLDLLSSVAPDLFSESTRWSLGAGGGIGGGGGPGGGGAAPPTDMDGALEGLVNSGLRNWLYGNFGFKPGEEDYFALLGGRLNEEPPMNGPGLDYLEPLFSAVSDGAYRCDIMNQVWLHAKCMDMIDVKEEDGFMIFAKYVQDPDKRFLPKRCPGINERWGGNAGNMKQSPIDKENTTGWIEDNVITFFELLDPENCEARNINIKYYDVGLTPIIETGLIVKNKNFPKGYKEKHCLPPGCYYQPKPGTREKGQCELTPLP